MAVWNKTKEDDGWMHRGRDRRSLSGIWVVGRTYPVASGLLTSCGSASMNSFVLSMLPYAAAFQTSSTGCSSGLPGSAAMTTTSWRNSLGRPDWVVDRGTRDPTASRAVAVHRRLPRDHRAVGRSRRSRGVPSPLSPRLSAGSVSCCLDARETCSHLQLINDRDSPFRRCLLDRRLKARDGETRESFQKA